MNAGVAKRREDRYNALRYVLADRRGRQFLQMVMEESGVFSSLYDGCPNALLVSEGRREVGLWVRDSILMHDVDMAVRIQQETNEREAYYASLREGETDE